MLSPLVLLLLYTDFIKEVKETELLIKLNINKVINQTSQYILNQTNHLEEK